MSKKQTGNKIVTATDSNGVKYFMLFIWMTNKEKATIFSDTESEIVANLLLERTSHNEVQREFSKTIKFENV